MRFEKILFYTRFKELAFNSLVSLLELKKAGLREVVLVYIVPREEVAFLPYGGYRKDEEQRLKEMARIRFEEWQEAIAEKGVESKIRVDVGAVNPKILAIAEEEKVDLIVAGRKKRTAFEKVYVGSHILDLVRRSPLPILMSKYMVQFEWEGELLTRVNDYIYQRPLLATDWSEPSENALNGVQAFRGVVEKAIVAHIITDKLTKGMDASGIKAIETESKKRLKAYCTKLEKAGIKAESHLSFGKTAPELIRLSREYKATMIVLGRTGKDWFQEYWLGGSSHRIAEISELPVLLVP